MQSNRRHRFIRTFAKSTTLALLVGAGAGVQAVNVSVDPGKTWEGFMDVLLPGGQLLFQSFWPIPQLSASFSPGQLTLTPNSDFGYAGYLMNASMQVNDATVVGQQVTFAGLTLSNTLVAPYQTVAFVRVFAADYSFHVSSEVVLATGQGFSLTAPSVLGQHVVYGFSTLGPNASSAAGLGSVVIQAVPEPASAVLLAAGALALLGLHTRRSRH